MTTTGLITYIQRKAPDWDRATLLSFLDNVQSMVFSSPNNLMRVIDDKTGRDPLLTTVAGQLVYELDEPKFGYDIQSVRLPKDSFRENDTGEYTNYNFFPNAEGRLFTVRNATPSSAAKVIFRNDPGDGSLPLVCFRKPERLTSERIQLEIPDQFHISHLAKGVIGIVEDAEHGTSNAWEKFEKELLPTMIWEMEKINNNMIVYNQGGGY